MIIWWWRNNDTRRAIFFKFTKTISQEIYFLIYILPYSKTLNRVKIASRNKNIELRTFERLLGFVENEILESGNSYIWENIPFLFNFVLSIFIAIFLMECIFHTAKIVNKSTEIRMSIVNYNSIYANILRADMLIDKITDIISCFKTNAKFKHQIIYSPSFPLLLIYKKL